MKFEIKNTLRIRDFDGVPVELIVDMLNRDYLGWCYFSNGKSDEDTLVNATRYTIKEQDRYLGGNIEKVKEVRCEYDQSSGNFNIEDIKNLKDININHVRFDSTPVYKEDTIYLLKEVGNDSNDNKGTVRVRWYKKGKLSEMKTYEQFVNDLDPYGEERWEDDKDYRDLSVEDLSVQRQLLTQLVCSHEIEKYPNVDFHYTELNRDTFDPDEGQIINVNEGPGHAESFNIDHVMLDEDGNIMFHTIIPEYIDEQWFDFDFWITVDRNHDIIVHVDDDKTITVKI